MPFSKVSEPSGLVHVNDLLHLIIAAQEDTGTIMDMFRHNKQHAIHFTIDGLTSSCKAR